jgi:methylaspartate mutase sigma subunit
MWNLLFIQLLMEENGWSVTNLGACTATARLLNESLHLGPDMIVISTVNGHGAQEAPRLITALRAEPRLAEVPVYLGGKICTSEEDQRGAAAELEQAGYSRVFFGEDAVAAFRSVLVQTAGRSRPLVKPRA